MEEGKGKDGDDGRVTSVFVMTLSLHFDFCDKARLSGRTGRTLSSAWSVHLVFDQTRLDWSWGLAPLFPYSVYKAGA